MEKKERRLDRRDSQDEREQLEIIKETFKKVKEEHGLLLNLEHFTSVSKSSKNRTFFNGEGKIVTGEKRNLFTDSKSLDCLGYFTGKSNRHVDVYCFCKYTKQVGGSQDMVPMEIGLTKRNVEKNNQDWVVVLFMLEGGYWKEDIIKQANFDNKKTFYVNRDTLEETLVNIFKENELI